MPSKMLKDFLDLNRVKYLSIRHSPAYTSQEIAAASHVRGKNFAKTVVLKVDGKICLAALPATYKIDFITLQKVLGAERVRLANETEFKDKFPGCEVGAMPPFGNLYGMDVFVAASLVEDEEIAFNAGTHTEIIKMQFKDFERLAHPKILRFSEKVLT